MRVRGEQGERVRRAVIASAVLAGLALAVVPASIPAAEVATQGASDPGPSSTPTVTPAPTPAVTPAPTPTLTPTPTRTSAPAAVPDAEEVFRDETLAGWSLEQTVASLLMVAVPGTDPAPARALIDAHGLGGMILMGSNTPGTPADVAAFTQALTTDPALPPLTAVDQEGGDVRRLAGDTAAAGRALHAADAASVEVAFAARSSLVDAAGIAINFGVVADVTADPAAFIHRRVLGETPAVAADHVAAAVRGEGAATVSTLKHFPGHGASPDDSHVSIPRASISLAEWRATHALPFQAGIDAGAELVMTGHLQFDAVSPIPASLSPTWMRVLRSDLGFDGVIVTDDLLMLQRSGRPEYADPYMNAVRALDAGNDLLLFVLPADPSAVGIDLGALITRLADAVRSGEVSADQVQESARRVFELRRGLSSVPAPALERG